MSETNQNDERIAEQGRCPKCGERANSVGQNDWKCWSCGNLYNTQELHINQLTARIAALERDRERQIDTKEQIIKNLQDQLVKASERVGQLTDQLNELRGHIPGHFAIQDQLRKERDELRAQLHQTQQRLNTIKDLVSQ
jgi:chromosome segregation ATPase